MAQVIATIFDKANWLMRRRYLFAVTAFVMALMVFASLGMVAEAVALAIINNGFWVLATLVGTYVFGATWDHANQRKFGSENTPGTTTTTATIETKVEDAPVPA